MREKPAIVLSLYPNMRGFGFVCLNWPKEVIDAGVTGVHPLCNGKLFRRFVAFLDFYKPELILLRDCTSKASKRSLALTARMAEHAREMKLPVYQYSRSQIQEVFEQFGARTKYEIALRLVEGFEGFKSKMPQIRKRWKEEDYHMAMFDALALAVTHKYLSE